MKNLELALMGDVMLGRLVNDHLKTVTPEYPWGDTLSILSRADIRICNLECVIADSGRAWSATPKVFYFRSDAKNVEVLKAAAIDGVSLANNHVLDFEVEAMSEMLKLLDKAKIAHAGAGPNQYAASMPAVIKANKTTVGLISFTDNEPSWRARPNQPGVFYVPIAADDRLTKVLFELTRKFKRQVDLLVIATHWGGNWGYTPPAEHITMAHGLIEAGADVIFGHSAHVFRGIEIYRRRPILYSTGDFIDDYAIDALERNDESFIFMLEVENSQIKRIRLYPTVIDNFQARLAGRRTRTIATKMERLCLDFDTKTFWRQKQGCLEIQINP